MDNIEEHSVIYEEYSDDDYDDTNSNDNKNNNIFRIIFRSIRSFLCTYK